MSARWCVPLIFISLLVGSVGRLCAGDLSRLPPPPDVLPPPLDGPELGLPKMDMEAAVAAAAEDLAAGNAESSEAEAESPRSSTAEPVEAVKVVEGSKKEQTGSSGPAVPKLDVPQDPLGFGALLREPWQLMSEPWQFLTEKSFSNSVELGLNGTEGNSQTTSLHAGFDLLWQSVQYRLRSNLNYQQTHADSKETQNNALWDNDWERMLGQTPWSWTTELMLEYDEFRNFDLRLVMNTGLGYYWIRRENASFSTRIGSGTSREFGGPSTEWKPEARFGAEGEYRFTPRQKFTGKADYYPAWDDFNDFRLVATLSWEILLDGSDNLSLKLFAQDRYDSTPEGRLPNDINYSALLLYKF